MNLDTHIPLGQLYPSSDEMRAAMIEIAQHKIDGREAAEDWSNHLRFLAADTTSQHVEPQVRDLGGSDSEDCTCVSNPSISLSKDERQLMVTDPADLAECTHYLAVSYCCSSSAEAKYNGLSYSVRRKGVVVAPACPSDSLRRVINFARECGLDYLWIDQECIEQDDPDDKDVGIQAMDLVYQMAEQSVAVLEVQINEQRHLDALGLLQVCDGEEDLSPADLQDLIEALEVVLGDRWFERTWCLQESTSAARKMALLIRRDPLLQLPDSLRGRTQTQTEFELDLSALQEQIPGWFACQVDLAGETDDHVLHARGSAILAAWSSLLVPDVGPSDDLGGRPICDAAEALWHMSRRSNSITSDRLAIFANLCEYDVRLDNRALDELGYGFSICAIVLAVLNGDFSLMAGIATYNAGLAGKVTMLLSDSGEPVGQSRAGFSWDIPARLSVENVLYWDKRQDSLRHKFEPSLSDKGLLVSGCLWCIAKVIDLSQIRDSFLQHEDQTNIASLLEDGPLGGRAPSEEARARLLLFLLCHLHKDGYRSLAKRIWQELRLKHSSNGNPEIEAWRNAEFEKIVDVESATVKWHSPFPVPKDRLDRAPVDPFRFLSNRFVQYLLSSILVCGQLPVGRLHNSGSQGDVYDAVFENASLGEIYLSPATNMGFGSPSRDRSWYPFSWRVTRDMKAALGADVPTFQCHGLVCGHWTAQADDVTEVRLM
ncbi:hypothetical protein Q7P35_003771 [Cladosporium inversicolor]